MTSATAAIAVTNTDSCSSASSPPMPAKVTPPTRPYAMSCVVGTNDGRVVGMNDGFAVGGRVGAGVNETINVMESESVETSAQASFSLYWSIAASAETTRICWPSFSVVSVSMMPPSALLNSTVTVVQIPGSPRYNQRSSHSSSATQVDSVPMLVICRKEPVGGKVGSFVGFSVGRRVGLGAGLAVGVKLGFGVDPGVGANEGFGVGVGPVVGENKGFGVGPGVGAKEGTWVVGAGEGTCVGTSVGFGAGASEGTRVGRCVGAGEVGASVGGAVNETWNPIESVRDVASSHVRVIVYSSISASPETVRFCWPSFSVLVVSIMFPSASATSTVTVVQTLGSPRYTHKSSHSKSATQVDKVPMLVICRKEAVGECVGAKVG